MEKVPIYVTGHSLGGGMAHLFAVALMLRDPGAFPVTLTSKKRSLLAFVATFVT